MASSTTKRVLFILLAVALIIGLLLPVFAFAQEAPQNCRRFETAQSKFGTETATRKDELSESRDERSQKLEEKVAQREQRIAEIRQKFDAKLEEHLERIANRATTKDQAKAVTNFGQTVKAAVSKRRAVVDEARQVFKDGVKAAILARRTSMDSALVKYRQAVSDAFASATEDCAAGVEISTVRSDLRTAIKAAKDEFRQARQDVRVGPQVKDLASQRRDAVQKARDEFKSTVEEAKDDVKDVLGVRAE